MKNLELWNSVSDVNLDFTKQVRVPGKQPFTNIDSYEIIRMATDKFGPYGKGFGIESMIWSEKEYGDTTMLILDVKFFYPDGKFPYRNMIKSVYKTKSGYLMVDEDSAKKIITNTIAKCLSLIGFGASVYLGMFDDQEYMSEMMSSREELISPTEVQKLIKGINYYKVDKKLVLDHFIITHLKDLPKSELNEAEAFIKKLGSKNEN